MLCRRSSPLGIALIASAVGILLSLLLPNTFLEVFVAVLLLLLGYFLLYR